MKLTIRCTSGLRIRFEGSSAELEHVDAFLSELAVLERDRLAPGRTAGDYSSDHSRDRSADPSPPSASGLAAERDAERPVSSPGGPVTADPASVASPVDDPPAAPPAAAATPAGGAQDEPRRSGRTPGSGRKPTTRPIIEQAVRDLGIATVSDILERTGLSRKAAQNALYRLKTDGVLVHNGELGKMSRWAPAGTTFTADEPREPADTAPLIAVVPDQPNPDALTDLEQQIVELVHHHGPVTADWIADQVVKNRRDTAVLMRDLSGRGVLAVDDGWYGLPATEEAAA